MRWIPLSLLLGCSGPTDPISETDAATDEGTGDTGERPGCATLSAAVIAQSQGLRACTEPLTTPFLSCGAGLTANACSAQLWDEPQAGADPGERLELVWAPQCRDGSDGCAPSDPDAVACVDGTRPYYYVAPGRTADGQPSRTWFFRWHNGQVAAADVAAGCGFDGTCADPLGSQRPGGVARSRSSAGLFADAPPPAGAWVAEANQVYFVDPCITDFYGGDRAHTASFVDPTTGAELAFPFQFRGAAFIDGVLAQLASGVSGMPALADADRIVLYAWSGGGRFVIQSLDRLAHDSDGDGVEDGGVIGALAPDATVGGVVASRVQPGLEVHELFARVDADAGRPDVDGRFTGAAATAAEADATGTVYDRVHAHGQPSSTPLPTHGGACPASAPIYPPFAGGSCWGDEPALSNATFRDGAMAELLDGWGYQVDASCLLAHPGAPETCRDFQHVLLQHVQGDVLVYISQHDQAYRSPTKLPTYADDPAYYWSPGAMRERVRKTLLDFARYRWTHSELATGADPSCAAGCTAWPAAVFSPDVYLHDDPVNSAEAAFALQLCGAGPPVALAEAIGRWSEGGLGRADAVLVEGVDGIRGCEDGSDADGDGLVGCDDPEWRYRLAPGSDLDPACP